MERRASRLFGTKRIKQSSLVCDNNNNEVEVSPTESNKSAALASAPVGGNMSKTEEQAEDRQRYSFSKQLKKMSNEELQKLLAMKGDLVIDRIIGRVPTIKKLEHERDELREQVLDLAYCNHAREPDFVRDRLKLRELTRDVNQLIRHLTGKHIEPMVNKLKVTEKELAQLARRHEEESETVAQAFLDEGDTISRLTRMDQDEAEQEQEPQEEELEENALTADEKRVRAFTNDYIQIRKQAIKKRTLADKLSKELDLLSGASRSLTPSTAPQPRQPSPVCRNVKIC